MQRVGGQGKAHVYIDDFTCGDFSGEDGGDAALTNVEGTARNCIRYA
jgi:hypothetical protein